jgi:hypothetical protein
LKIFDQILPTMDPTLAVLSYANPSLADVRALALTGQRDRLPACVTSGRFGSVPDVTTAIALAAAVGGHVPILRDLHDRGWLFEETGAVSRLAVLAVQWRQHGVLEWVLAVGREGVDVPHLRAIATALGDASALALLV